MLPQALEDSLTSKEVFFPICQLVTLKDILHQAPQRVQTVSRHPLEGLSYNECLSKSVFLAATYIPPCQAN